jgi:hypothetical protein
MAKEILLTASVGIFLDGDSYYLHVIFAESDRHLLQKISTAKAFSISRSENLEIEQIYPEDLKNLNDF